MYPSEWAGRRIETFANYFPVVWAEDPYHLIEPGEIQTLKARLALKGHDVVSVADAFSLRLVLNSRDPSTARLVLIDQSYTLREAHLLPKDAKPQDLVPLKAPDWKPLLDRDAIFRPTVRGFLIGVTEDHAWPAAVDIFPYEELARSDPDGFVRAFESFRETGRPVTEEDLVMVGASAVLKIDLLGLSDPVLALELAFHSERSWRELSKFFNRAEVELIRERLCTLPAPLGQLFGPLADTARLAVVSLMVFSQHSDTPGRLLPILSPALAPYVDCPAMPVSEPPSWFLQEEVPRFEELVDSNFLKYLNSSLQLTIPENARRLAEHERLSSKLRSQVAYEVPSPRAVAGLVAAELDFSIDILVPQFRDSKQSLAELVRQAGQAIERLRLTPPGQAKTESVLHVYDQEGMHKVDLLLGTLNSLIRDIEGPARRNWQAIPGFEERWNKDLLQCRDLMSQAARLRDDLDYEFGRLLESRYAQVVPPILTTGMFYEMFIAPRRRAADGKLCPALILVVDSMRLDIWRLLIQPALEREYFLEEQLGFAELPSETAVSRSCFFAGKAPADLLPGARESDQLADLVRRAHGSAISFTESGRKRQGMRYYVCSNDSATRAGVFNFPDLLSHHVDWDQPILHQAYQPFVREIRAVLAELGRETLVFITSDHGHYRPESASPIFLDNAQNVGYRRAYVASRVEGQHARHLFQILAHTLRHNLPGYFVFPKPGYHLRSREEHGTGGRSEAAYRHGGLSMAEVVVPVVALRHRAAPAVLRISVSLRGAVVVGRPAAIQVSLSADGVVRSPIRLGADTSDVESIIVAGASSTPESHVLRYVPASPGRRRILIHAVLGEQPAATAPLDVDVAPAPVPEDEARIKLRKIWGDD